MHPSPTFTAEASGDELDAVDRGLEAHNAREPALGDVLALAVVARDPGGTLAGGAVGRTWGTSCELQQLWVREDRRGEGVGRALVRRFEDEARARGCTLVYLATFSFQAPAFYASLGYATALETRGYTRGIVRYLMQKRLDADA